jgi:exodeoxyribonuclease III
MKIVSYNVNGIRSAMNKGLVHWLKEINADVVCLQELKANYDQIDVATINELGYEVYTKSAEKKGYSGVGILCKKTPINISFESGMSAYDSEGRFIRVDYEEVSIISAYFPSGSSGEERQAFKMQFLNDYLPYIKKLKEQLPNLVICGDYNICHKAIDIHNPKNNVKTSGFLPEERAWMDTYEAAGFVDAFRIHNPNPHEYTWWSLRSNARERNLGWRIDYHWVTDGLKTKVKDSVIYPHVKHSDHCPIVLTLDV